MRGHDEQSGHLFSYLSPERRVPPDHPLRAIRAMTDEALRRLSRRFEVLYATTGRPSIPPSTCCAHYCFIQDDEEHETVHLLGEATTLGEGGIDEGFGQIEFAAVAESLGEKLKQPVQAPAPLPLPEASMARLIGRIAEG